ncbi:unnamed protein product [Miscanthus lutarioriparius]|uniref:Uncharacterized protein n=1 Tax=Miscanthus lutarioriparius TaxID=422564 RepID=A0A811QYN8_9POAL|nr:unnamed protein product [Miscanthus lutarioriparius]
MPRSVGKWRLGGASGRATKIDGGAGEPLSEVETPSLCYMSCSPGTRLPRTSPPSVAPVHHVGHPSGQHIAMNKEVHLQARVHVIVAGTEESNTDEGWNFQENAMKQLQNFLAPLLILGLMLSSMSSSTADQKEVIT